MRHQRRIAGRGDEQQMNRPLREPRPSLRGRIRHLGKCGIQRGKGVALDIEILTEVCFDRSRIGLNRISQARYFEPLGQLADLREFGREISVNEHQLAGSIRKRIRSQVRLADLVSSRAGKLERSLRNGRDVRETPVFVMGRRKADFAEAGKSVLAQLTEPAKIVAGSAVFWKLLKLSR